MKKLFLLTFLIFYGITTSNAQDADFVAVTAGYLNTIDRTSIEGQSENISNSGFYAGLIVEKYISYEFWIQAELLYANADDTSLIQIPILAKFYLSDNFNLMAGPQISYRLEKAAENFTNLNIGLSFGVGYDITQNLTGFTRYTLQLNDYYTGSGDFSFKNRFFSVGLAYKLKDL